MTNEPINIVLGLKDNDNCHKMAEGLDKYLMSTGKVNLGVTNSVFTKDNFDAAVRSRRYEVGLVLEKIDDTAIGQGTLNNWKKRNPQMRIILVMDSNRRGQIKSKALFDKEYYNGLYLEDFSNGELLKLLNEDRTKEDAFYYYGLETFVEAKSKEERLAKAEEKVIETATSVSDSTEDEPAVEESVEKTANSYISRTFNKSDEEDNETPDKLRTKETEPEDLKALIKKSEAKQETEERSNDELVVTEKQDPTEEDNSAEDLTLENAVNNNKPAVADSNDKEGAAFANTTEDSVDEHKNSYEQYLKENTNTSASAQHIFTDEPGATSNTSSENLKDEHKKKTELIIKQKSSKRYDATKNLDDEDSLNDYIKRVTDKIKPIQVETDDVETQEDVLFDLCVRQYSYQEEVVLDTALTTSDRETFENGLADFIDSQPGLGVEKQAVFTKFLDYVYNYGIISELLNMEDVESVHILDYNKIRIKRGGERLSTALSFRDERHYRRYVKNIELLHRDIYTTNTETVSIFTDRTFSADYAIQVSIYKANHNSNGLPEIVMRKYSKKKLSITEMIGGKLTVKSAAVIINAVQNGEGILLCGPASCGSTTLLNAMLDYIPLSKSGIVLQHKDELVTDVHPELIIQHPVAATNRDKGITISELAEAALLLDVDYYILGDVMGEECAYLYSASTYGYIPWTSLKATSVEDGILSFVDAIVSSVSNLPAETILNTVLKKFKYIVYMEDKKVISIAKVKRSANRASLSAISESLEYLDIK